MNGRGIPGAHASSTSSDEQLGGAGRDHGYWADSFEPSTDWFSPVSPQQQTAVGLLDRESDAEITAEQSFAPISGRYPAQDHPSFPPGALEITPDDVLEALGPQADEMLATADIDVDEDRKSTRLNSSHSGESRMPSSA